MEFSTSVLQKKMEGVCVGVTITPALPPVGLRRVGLGVGVEDGRMCTENKVKLIVQKTPLGRRTLTLRGVIEPPGVLRLGVVKQKETVVIDAGKHLRRTHCTMPAIRLKVESTLRPTTVEKKLGGVGGASFFFFFFACGEMTIWTFVIRFLLDAHPSLHNGGSIVMGAHWNTQNTSKYITIRILMYFDVFCVFQWAPLPSQYCNHYPSIHPPPPPSFLLSTNGLR